VVHGGAWEIPGEIGDDVVAAIRRSLAAGWQVLTHGGSAVEAVEAAVVVLEDDELFDAGRGSHLDQDGGVTLDAMLMDGSTLAAGSILAAKTIRNPIRAARLIMERSPHVYLAGEGADRFAADHGLDRIENADLIVARERARWEQLRDAARPVTHALGHDTVGAVAMDSSGHLAAGTSTGGKLFKPVGRVGDSPIIGSGGYADDELGAVSCTGDGESIARLVLAKWALDRVGDGVDPQAAARAAVTRLEQRLGATGGLIVIDRDGHHGAAFTTPNMAWGVRTVTQENATTG
jgi:L-asparaginase / beta-aspartyl-peptidase